MNKINNSQAKKILETLELIDFSDINQQFFNYHEKQLIQIINCFIKLKTCIKITPIIAVETLESERTYFDQRTYFYTDCEITCSDRKKLIDQMFEILGKNDLLKDITKKLRYGTIELKLFSMENDTLLKVGLNRDHLMELLEVLSLDTQTNFNTNESFTNLNLKKFYEKLHVAYEYQELEQLLKISTSRQKIKFRI